jgi:hypothetical protein
MTLAWVVSGPTEMRALTQVPTIRFEQWKDGEDWGIKVFYDRRIKMRAKGTQSLRSGAEETKKKKKIKGAGKRGRKMCGRTSCRTPCLSSISRGLGKYEEAWVVVGGGPSRATGD